MRTHNVRASLSRAPKTRAHHVRITAKNSWFSFSFREIWEFRELARILAARDITLRYRQTLFGLAGVIFAPLATALITSFVFGSVADLPSEGVPYITFSYAGYLGWNMFSGLLGRCSGVLVGNASLVNKIYVPRLLLPLSAVFVAFVDFGISSILMVVLMVAFHVVPGVQLLLLPVWILGLSVAAVGIGSAVAAAQAHYRDVGTLVAFGMQAWLYLTPVAYSSTAVPQRFRVFYELNPVSALIEGLRWSILGTHAPSAGRVAISLAGSVVLVVLGSMVFTRLERSVADVI